MDLMVEEYLEPCTQLVFLFPVMDAGLLQTLSKAGSLVHKITVKCEMQHSLWSPLPLSYPERCGLYQFVLSGSSLWGPLKDGYKQPHILKYYLLCYPFIYLVFSYSLFITYLFFYLLSITYIYLYINICVYIYIFIDT